MPGARDVVIIGAGHNGLVTAFYLAKAGFKPLVLERREQVGGAAITDEFHPGFKVSTLAHAVGPIRPDIMRDMQLERHGLQMLRPDPCVVTLTPDGRSLSLYRSAARCVEEIARFSKRDSEQYPEFEKTLKRIGAVMSQVLAMAPPSIDHPSTGDIFKLLKTGKDFRGLGRKDMFRVLRWGPMAVADLVAEFFNSELLRAVIAARGIFGTALGPWSAGSGTVFLMRAASDSHPAGTVEFPQGGMGALTTAMAAAAQQAGAEIRSGAEIEHIAVKDGAVTGVILKGGEEITARAVISNADPRRTLLSLLDPVHLEPDFIVKLRNFRATGTSAKVNLALNGLPAFAAMRNANEECLAARLHIGPEIDYLERAFDCSKYGEFSDKPYLDVLIPSVSDPSLAPAGKHVMSVHVQFAPYKLKKGDWNSQREALGDTVIKTLADYAPNLPSLIAHRQVITPQDLEDTYGLTGGHIFHGELALDQIFTMRPMLDWARYNTPIKNLFLCGSGTHPGAGLTGASGVNAAREITRELRK
ncbi:MAG TPA: NAD(P)/FAD-dependent oxidoreductase [Terriglobales bacterium]|nr:NAD(P)/FAD-dependent oxidoreductase [Terriglobales bacterium]